MDNLDQSAKESATGTGDIEAICPTCNTFIIAASNETEIYCDECKCIVMQLLICTKDFNLKKRRKLWLTHQNLAIVKVALCDVLPGQWVCQ